LNAPWLLTNRQFQWTGNGHSQLPLAELGKPSPKIDLLHSTGSNGRVICHCLTLTFDLWSWPTIPGKPRSRSSLMPKIKVKDQTVQTGERPQTNGRTHTDATKRIISPATRSIINWYLNNWLTFVRCLLEYHSMLYWLKRKCHSTKLHIFFITLVIILEMLGKCMWTVVTWIARKWAFSLLSLVVCVANSETG